MRIFKNEEVLKKLARNMCKTVVEIPANNKPEFRRETTPEEKCIMFKLAYGALLGLNNLASRTFRHPDTLDTLYMEEENILISAEFTFMQFFPYCNSCFSFYYPLRDIVRKWSEEAWNIPCKEWYSKAYPCERLLTIDMNDKATFGEVYDALENKESVYDLTNIWDDSSCRRLLHAVAHIGKRPYEEIYQMWLCGGRK